MSGWIRIEKSLETDPRVLRAAKNLAASIPACNAGALHPVTLVVGGLARLWMYADSHAREDDTLDLGFAELDELLGIPGFCRALPECWLREVSEGSVELPGFQEHNGVEARKRALTQKRVSRHRSAQALQPSETRNAAALPDQTRPDQTKTTKEEGAGAPSSSGSVTTIGTPAGLNAEAFSRWDLYLRRSGKPLNDFSRAGAQRKLAAMGDEARQAATVEHCIANGWRTLHPIRDDGSPQQRAPYRRRTADEIEAEVRARGGDPYALD